MQSRTGKGRRSRKETVREAHTRKKLELTEQDEEEGEKNDDLQYENDYLRAVMALKKTIPTWERFFQRDLQEERGNGWVRLEVIGKYTHPRLFVLINTNAVDLTL